MSEAFDSSSPSTDVSGIEITLELEEALAVLSPRQRAAFILIRLLGYKPKEVAEMWGLAGTSSISRTLDRALYKLRNNISTERSFRLPVARATNKKAEIDG
jgi:RNA polymerase sigma factor (sigma-70 family)